MERVFLGFLLATAGLLAAPSPWAQAQGADQIDPSCSAPNRLSVVSMVRAEAVQRLHRVHSRVLAPMDLSSLALGLSWDPQARRPRLFLHGPTGQSAQIEAASVLSPKSWQSFLTVNLAGNGVDWFDDTADFAASQFYRLTVPENDPATEVADDFLALDHEGKARELFYPSNLKALVLAAAGESSADLALVLAALKPLALQNNPSEVQFWVLLNDRSADRTNISQIVQATGVDFRVLLDPEGLGTLALRLSHAGEVVVVQPPTFFLRYRGQLKLPSPGTVPEQTYLSAALGGVTQDKPFSFLRTPLTGSLLVTSTAAVPNYTQDVAPIFRQHCAICHRPNDVAPFAMTEYAVISSWAPVIKHALLSNEMPPWHVDPAYGHWTNSVALPAADRLTLLRWIDEGAPRGTGSDPLAELALPPSFRVWPAELGPPDALVTPGMQSVKAVGSEPYRYLFVQTPNPSNVWLRAAIVLPSSPAIVHHYLVWTGKVGNKSPLPNLSTYNDALAGYVPGVAPYVYPADSGYQLGTSNWVTFNLHYTPNGLVTNDLPTLALWYHKTKPAKSFHSAGPLNLFFEIPPGDQEYPVAAPDWTIDHPIRLHRLNPHMHLRGKRMSYAAVYPDGTRETLLSVPDYNFRWQNGYQLAEPKMLPAGTRIVVEGAFDNSDLNLANPDPTATVIWGDQTSSEMFVGFLDYVD